VVFYCERRTYAASVENKKDLVKYLDLRGMTQMWNRWHYITKDSKCSTDKIWALELKFKAKRPMRQNKNKV
jgi:hypothetical protein